MLVRQFFTTLLSGDNIFKVPFGSSLDSLSLGDVAAAGPSEEYVAAEVSVIGSLAAGGNLGPGDLVYVPEPTTMTLLGRGLAAALLTRRRDRPSLAQRAHRPNRWRP